jgi:ParB family chromosome partitioning protein
MEDTPDVKIRCSLIEEGFNYRRRFKPEKITQMQASFDLHGLLNALIVRPLDGGRFQLLVGGYRYKSWTGKFGTESDIRANVRMLTDEQALSLMMAENSERDDPSVIEDAEGAARMLGFCNGSRDEASARLGWTRSKLDRRLAVMNAVQSVRDAYLDDKLTVGHVEIFAALRSEVQERLQGMPVQHGQPAGPVRPELFWQSVHEQRVLHGEDRIGTGKPQERADRNLPGRPHRSPRRQLYGDRIAC